MEKRRYKATREPLDLDCFIANFMEDYEECDTLQIGHYRQALSSGSREPHQAVGEAIKSFAAAAGSG
jgi:hypothetical protein